MLTSWLEVNNLFLFLGLLLQFNRLIMSKVILHSWIICLYGCHKWFQSIINYVIFISLANNDHPLTKVVVEYANKFKDEENPSWAEAHDFVSIVGHEVKAIVCNKELMVGNKSLFTYHNIAILVVAEDLLAEVEILAQTENAVSINGEVYGILEVFDPLKSGAEEVIYILKSMKTKSIMVIGDNWELLIILSVKLGLKMLLLRWNRIKK